jgi:hypothetical protein
VQPSQPSPPKPSAATPGQTQATAAPPITHPGSKILDGHLHNSSQTVIDHSTLSTKMSTQAIVNIDIQGKLPKVASGKVRDLYAIDDDTLLFVASDRISAYDVIMENVSY